MSSLANYMQMQTTLTNITFHEHSFFYRKRKIEESPERSESPSANPNAETAKDKLQEIAEPMQ